MRRSFSTVGLSLLTRVPSLALWAVALLAISRAPLLAQVPDAAAEAGFQHFYNLEYDDALAVFRAEAASNPNSPEALNHIAQTILYREMFRTGTLETQMVTGNNPFLRRSEMKISKADEQELLDSLARAISLAEARLQTNPNDTAALYAQGVSY